MDKFREAYYAIRQCGFNELETRNFLKLSRRVCREWTRQATQRMSQRLTTEQRELIKTLVLVEGKSFREVANLIGCHKQSVGRWVAKLRQKQAAVSNGIDFQNTRAICPIHGKLTVWPCVACSIPDNQSMSVDTISSESIDRATANSSASLEYEIDIRSR